MVLFAHSDIAEICNLISFGCFRNEPGKVTYIMHIMWAWFIINSWSYMLILRQAQ